MDKYDIARKMWLTLNSHWAVEHIGKREEATVRFDELHLEVKVFEELEKENSDTLLKMVALESAQEETYVYPIGIRQFSRIGVWPDFFRTWFIFAVVDDVDGLSTKNVLDLNEWLAEMFWAPVDAMLKGWAWDGVHSLSSSPLPKWVIDSLQVVVRDRNSPIHEEKVIITEEEPEESGEPLDMETMITMRSLVIIQSLWW